MYKGKPLLVLLLLLLLLTAAAGDGDDGGVDAVWAGYGLWCLLWCCRRRC